MILKTTLLFMAIVLTQSCSTKEEELTESSPEFFRKYLKIEDEFGNMANIEVYSLDEENVNNITSENLKLVTTRKKLDKSILSPKETNSTVSKKDDKSKIFIDVLNYSIDDDITGFRVEVVSDLELRSSFYYSYGSQGTRGVFVSGTVTPLAGASCWIHYDLEKLTNSGSWWYSGLQEWNIFSGQSGSWCYSGAYYKYRLEMEYNIAGPGFCSDWDEEWYWLTSCS